MPDPLVNPRQELRVRDTHALDLLYRLSLALSDCVTIVRAMRNRHRNLSLPPLSDEKEPSDAR